MHIVFFFYKKYIHPISPPGKGAGAPLGWDRFSLGTKELYLIALYAWNPYVRKVLNILFYSEQNQNSVTEYNVKQKF